MNDFIEGLIGFGGFIALISAIPIGLIIFFRKRRYNSEWTGKVTDKNSGPTGVMANGTGYISSRYIFTIKDAADKNRTVEVSQGVYDDVKIGDKVIKRKGDWNPTKA